MADSIKKLTELFAKFPTIGSRTAGRFVYYLLNAPQTTVDELIATIQELKKSVRLCSFCFNPHETQGQLCEICQDPNRNKQLLCVVEKEADLLSIEKTKRYKGLYFILGGNVLLYGRSGKDAIRLEELKARAKESFTEIILALNPTPEGMATSATVQKALKEIMPTPLFKITHLATGLPMGGELEYADEQTLESAFEGRK